MGRGLELSCRQLLEEDGSERGEGEGGVQVHMLMKSGVDLWPGSARSTGHICLAVGLEQVWGCIDECVPVCLCIYEPRVHEMG